MILNTYMYIVFTLFYLSDVRFKSNFRSTFDWNELGSARALIELSIRTYTPNSHCKYTLDIDVFEKQAGVSVHGISKWTVVHAHC